MKRGLQRRRVLLGGLLLVSAQAIPTVSAGDGELPQGWQQPFPQVFRSCICGGMSATSG